LQTGGKFSFGVLDTVGVDKGISEDLDKGGEVLEFHGVIFDMRGDLVKGVVLKTINGEAELFLGCGEGGGFQTELYQPGAEAVKVSFILFGVGDFLGGGGRSSRGGDWGSIPVAGQGPGDSSFSIEVRTELGNDVMNDTDNPSLSQETWHDNNHEYFTRLHVMLVGAGMENDPLFLGTVHWTVLRSSYGRGRFMVRFVPASQSAMVLSLV
jgi:hypothetical protein